MLSRRSPSRPLAFVFPLALFALACALPLIGRSAAPPPPPPLLDEPTSYQPQFTPLTAGGDGEIWSVALSPDRKTLAVATGGPRQRPNATGALVLYDYPSGKLRATLPTIRAVRWVAFSPDGKHLATAEFDSTAKLRDPRTGIVRHTLDADQVGVGPLLFTPNSKTLVTGGLSNAIKTWDVASGKLTRTLEGHTTSVLGMCLAADGKTLYSLSRQSVCKVFDLTAGKELHSWQMVNGYQGECLLLTKDGKTLISTHGDGMVRFWDVASRGLASSISAHTTLVTMAALSPDGKTLATGGQDNAVRLWDVGAKTALAADTMSHNGTVYGLAFDKDTTLITGSWDKSVKVWQTQELKPTQSLTLPQFSPEMMFPLTGLACSRDGSKLALCGEGKVIKVIDAKSGQILRLLEGHEDVVARVAFSPDGTKLASAGFDEKAILWDVEPGKALHTLKGHEGWVYAVAFSPDGKTLASGGYDRSVRFWDVATGKQTERYDKNRGGVRGLAYAPDGKSIAFAGADKVVKVWNFAKKEVTLTLKGHEDTVRAIAFSPDGKFLASGGEDNTLRLWDLGSGKQAGRQNFNDSVRDVAFSPRGASLACACQDNFTRVLDPRTAAVRGTPIGHDEPATSLAYSPDAQTLYTAGLDRSVRAWRGAVPAGRTRYAYRDHGAETWVSLVTPDGRSLITAGVNQTIQVRPLKSDLYALDAATGLAVGVACSPDGKYLAVACNDQTICLFDRKSGHLVRRTMAHSQGVWCVAFSHDSKLLASGSGLFSDKSRPGEVKIWDVETGQEQANLVGHTSIIAAVAFAPDGKTLASCSWDGSVRLWDVETGNNRATLGGFEKDTPIRSLAFRPDGLMLVAAGFDGQLKAWNPATAKEVFTLKSPGMVLHGVGFSPDGKTLAVGTNPKGNADQPLWSGKGPGKVVLYDVESKKEIRKLEGPLGKVLAVTFSPDGKTLASGGNPTDTAVKLWDWQAGKLLRTLPVREFIGSLAFAPDSRFLYAAGGSKVIPDGVMQWDLKAESERIVLKGHTGTVCSAALSKDGKVLATGSFDKSIRLWDTSKWALIAELKGHTGPVRGLTFSPEGKTLASASEDLTVRLWDVDGGKEKQVLTKFPVPAKSVAYSPDGTLLAAGCSQDGSPVGGLVRVFETATNKERPGAWSSQAGLSLAFSPDGRTLATGAPGNPALFLYETSNGRMIRSLPNSSIRTLTFSPDGETLATGHGTGGRRGDGSIQLWDTRTWAEKGYLSGHGSLCLQVAYSRDGKTLTSASTDGSARVWDLPRMGRAQR